MRQIRRTLPLQIVVCFLLFLFFACGKEEEVVTVVEPPQKPVVTVDPVSNLKAQATLKANELLVTWDNPEEASMIHLSWWLENQDESEAETTTMHVSGGQQSEKTIEVKEYGSYCVGAVVMDSYGNRSEQVVTQATPAEEDYPVWETIADSCTYVLIEQFMDKSKGTFWSTPNDVAQGSWNIYWQQAHAMDVVVYSYERIKDSDPDLAATYENYFRLWYENDANNYNNDPNDETGFLNNFTDDMCWICLTLIHMTEATGDNLYIETAKKVYDEYIITRVWSDENGTGLPWTATDLGRNACTNAPGCLIAAKLYQRYGDAKYLEDAKILHTYVMNNLKYDNGAIEEPPLTYTQGTFGEACRRLYHITGDPSYMRTAEEVIQYAFTSDRCTHEGILRSEGESMDQSIFKAVLIPYAVNLLLDEETSSFVRSSLRGLVEKNARALYQHLDRNRWPEMYCSYYWGEAFLVGTTASMGAQTSGASLMEGMARIEKIERESK